MKHLLKLTFLLLALLLPATVSAHDFEVDGIYYNVNGNEATVTYRGSSYYQYSNEYTGNVIIPASVTYNGKTYPVTSIGDCAFYNCSSLTSVTIPNSVTTIGSKVFSGCSGLKKLIVDSGNPVFDSRDNCNAINETATNTLITGCMNTTIPNSVTTIGNSAFSGCSGLTSVTIPNSVTSIGNSAFYCCSGLTSVTIGNSVTFIGEFSFEGCSSLTSLTIPNSVTYIGASAFSECTALKTLNFNAVSCEDFEIMFDYSLPFCDTNISTINIGNDVQRIPAYFAIGQAQLSNLTIGNSVTAIGDGAFEECRGLTSIAIPNSVTSIGYMSFWCCSGLTSVTIGNSVTSIGMWAFECCWSLTRIIVESGNTTYDSRDNCNAIIETATNMLITGCMNTTIPNSVTFIGDYAFSYCSGLTSVTIPNSVTTIGEGAFRNCSGLTSITIPDSVTSIGWGALEDCSGLNEVYSFIIDPSLISMDWDVFYRYPNNYTARTLYVPVGTVSAYQVDTKWSQYFGSIVEIAESPVLAEEIKLNVTTAGLNEGATLQLTATVLPENSEKTVLWASNNPSVATVDSNGLVTTHGIGTATIAAITTDGSNLSTACTVTLLPVGVKGDVNGDSKISISDVTTLIDFLLTGDWSE